MSSGRAILALNRGSSSLKLGLFTMDESPRRLAGGEVSRLDSATPLLQFDDDRESSQLDGSAAPGLLAALRPRLAGRALGAIAHRLVHGGESFVGPTRITTGVRAALDRLIPLAPNHLPTELQLIDECAAACPGVPQVACFDTAFHRDLPAVSRTLPVPPHAGLRRYGFHGLSYAFILSELRRLAAPLASGRVIVAHLGNGASLAAIAGGAGVDTSMGLTPGGGVVMSTRSGDLDPGVTAYLLRTHGWSADALEQVLTGESGLKAISGGESDMRALLAAAAADPRAELAVEIFCYQVRKWIGAFAAALGGLDLLVFTGGIGEHAAEVRRRICEPLAFLGVTLEAGPNARHAAVISAAGGPVEVRVMPTDEALMMARDTRTLLGDDGAAV